MSLYLKYRPADFKNLVWQVFVKETLQKAVKNNKTVGAYLFCWPRWTWKTSSARIFAKAINCENPNEWNPCLECSICKDFTNERLVDIIEIDAASHTWVDNIREIIERAQFTPTKTKYKIYIIDEVHMLSKWAFNALLKILEEPPSHVKFILATTETHKVPETIISRCQRYDFKRISNTDIKERLNYIAENENLVTDEKAIDYIVKNSWWWLRNAISLFEQLIFDGEINYNTIIEKLEIVDENIIDSFLNKLITKDSTVIEIFDKLIDDWKNIKLFFKELLFYTKLKSLEELRLNNNLSNYIEILELLDETYTKTKHSLDENTTFLIWILKILNWNTVKTNLVNSSNMINITNNSNIQQNTNKANNITEKKEENNLSHDDIFDIFWEEETPPEQIKNQNTNNDNINLELLKSNLKKLWAKWWLVLAIPAAKFDFYWNTLAIWTNTKIHKNQFENPDNQNLILKALDEMWYQNINLKIN